MNKTTIEDLLMSPCIFCGYKAGGYFQSKSHKKHCYWYHIGGLSERIESFVKAANERRLRIMSPSIDVSEYYVD